MAENYGLRISMSCIGKIILNDAMLNGHGVLSKKWCITVSLKQKIMIIGWLPFLVWHIVWLRKRKPFHREKEYWFYRSGFRITIKRW